MVYIKAYRPMNKSIILLSFILLVSPKVCCSQQKDNVLTSVIEPKEYYVGKGIIFHETYDPHILLKDAKKRFTPNDSLIIRSEKILLEQYSTVKQVKSAKFLKKYNRQYIGYINTNGDKVVLIQLLKIKSQSKMNDKFLNWQNEYIVGFGTFYERNTERYIVNIKQNLLSRF